MRDDRSVRQESLTSSGRPARYDERAAPLGAARSDLTIGSVVSILCPSQSRTIAVMAYFFFRGGQHGPTWPWGACPTTCLVVLGGSHDVLAGGARPVMGLLLVVACRCRLTETGPEPGWRRGDRRHRGTTFRTHCRNQPRWSPFGALDHAGLDLDVDGFPSS